MKIVVTGVVGFIGFHLTKKLLEEKKIVIGLDANFQPCCLNCIAYLPNDSAL